VSTLEQEVRWADVDRMTDARLAEHLRQCGYLVIPPGDASPVGELVRAAIEYAEAPMVGTLICEADDRLHMQAYEVRQDPAVRQWAERGRE
jgi:hypothetical protein